MKSKNFYYLFNCLAFIICCITSFIISGRIINIGGILATASVMLYPLTYFLAIMMYERYGKEKIHLMFNFAITALLFCVLFISFASILPAYDINDGLDKLFNVDYRIFFSYLVSFYFCQHLNIILYDFLGSKKTLNFLTSATITITIDSIIFVLLGYLGVASFEEILKLFTGQFVFNVVSLIIYGISFAYLIKTVIETKQKEIMKDIVKEDKIVEKPLTKEVKTSTKPKTKKTTTKKDDTTKKESTTKKTTTSKKTTSTKVKEVNKEDK